MNETDVEARLRAALAHEAHSQVGADEVPPPVDWSQPARHHGWVAPVAAAAAVAVVAGGAFALTQSQRRSTEPVPAVTVTVAPTPSVTTPAPTGTAAPTGTTSDDLTVHGTPTQMLGATLVVPVGWTARSYSGSGQSTPINDTWCIDRPGTSDCAIQLMRMRPDRNPIDADIEGGLLSNPGFCGSTEPVPTLIDYQELTFGGRNAEYRSWASTSCSISRTQQVAQYTVSTPTAYTLWSQQADDGVRSTMAAMAATAILPAETSATRLYDHGIVTKVTAGANGSVVVTIDRTVIGRPNTGTATYVYTVPAAVASSPSPLTQQVGKTVSVFTDGTNVTQWFVG